jgi:hypothetical protein
MKIFIPMPDESGQQLGGSLVPFSSEFIGAHQEVKEGRMPRNWLSDDDYTSACKRLRVNHQPEVFATA